MTESRFEYEVINGWVVYGPFLRHWRGLGERAETIFGVPISRETIRKCSDGQLHHVQYFERWVMELHGDVVVGRKLGAEEYRRIIMEGGQ